MGTWEVQHQQTEIHLHVGIIYTYNSLITNIAEVDLCGIAIACHWKPSSLKKEEGLIGDYQSGFINENLLERESLNENNTSICSDFTGFTWILKVLSPMDFRYGLLEPTFLVKILVPISWKLSVKL